MVGPDPSQLNRDMIGLYSYVGNRRQGTGDHHEGINVIATVLGSSLCGVDVRAGGGYDRVRMCEGYFNGANGQDVFLNVTDGRTGGSFWYERATFCSSARAVPTVRAWRRALSP
jgi:hypothetical protein